MTAETIHTCSYSCERPACIRAQRDELASRLAAAPPPAAAQQGQAVAWADEWRAAVAAKLSSYGLSEEAAAVFASSELDEYKAGLCDCAENDPVDMVDLMMGVARDAIEKWKIESAGRPFGHKNTAPPPSAPVGVDGFGSRAVAEELLRCFESWEPGVRVLGNVQAKDAADLMRRILAQQPAAVDGVLAAVRAEVVRATAKFPTWPTDPLHASGVVQEESGELAKAVLQAVYEPQKSTPEDVATEAFQTAAMAVRFLLSMDRYQWQRGEQHAQNALTAQPGGSDNDR